MELYIISHLGVLEIGDAPCAVHSVAKGISTTCVVGKKSEDVFITVKSKSGKIVTKDPSLQVLVQDPKGTLNNQLLP